MSSRHKEINGKTYRVYYRHVRPDKAVYDFEGRMGDLEDYESLIDEVFDDALGRNQVKNLCRDQFPCEQVNAFTVCIIEDLEKNEVARGYAMCSRKDQFNKKIGRKISFGRAVKSLKVE